MAFTIATLVEDAQYVTRLTQADYAGDRVRKVNRLLNLLDIGGTDQSNLQLFWRAYESCSDAAIDLATISQEVPVTGQNTTAGQNLHSKISDRLVLWFSKEHPLNAAKTVWASFIVVAPKDDIITATGANAGRPVLAEGETLTSAATNPEKLNAMIQYLASALTYLAIDGAYYNGGWQYSAADSRLITTTHDVGGNPLT